MNAVTQLNRKGHEGRRGIRGKASPPRSPGAPRKAGKASPRRSRRAQRNNSKFNPKDGREDNAKGRQWIIGCEIISRRADAQGLAVVDIDTDKPWAIRSIEDESRFTVLAVAVVEFQFAA